MQSARQREVIGIVEIKIYNDLTVEARTNIPSRNLLNLALETSKQDLLAELIKREREPQIEVAPSGFLGNGRA